MQRVRRISPEDQVIVRSQIGSIIGRDMAFFPEHNVKFVDDDCAELFRRFEKTLDTVI